MRACMAALAISIALSATTAGAHGPQIQITADAVNANKIVTRQLLLDEPYSSAVGLTTPTTVYVMPVLPVSYLGQPAQRVKPSGTQTFGPGFTYGYDQLLGGERLFTANLNLHVAGLQIWDGSAFVPTGSNKEQFGLLQSSSNVVADAIKTTASGGDIAISVAAGYTADVHSSMRYSLLGDGLDPYAASRDGVYLATLQLSGTQTTPSLTTSDPFYFILSKNVSTNDLSAVVSSFISSRGIGAGQVQNLVAVPEPSIIALGVCLWVGLIARCRPRRSAKGSHT